MKFSISRQWCAEKGKVEDGVEIGAGLLGIDPLLSSDSESAAIVDDSRVALGRFTNLNRRQRKLSYEALADIADVEIAELMNIEHDASYEPEPRTVYQLASVFKVDAKKMMELAGLIEAKDASYIEDAVRYAARSESLEELDEQERAALDAMVAVLSKK